MCEAVADEDGPFVVCVEFGPVLRDGVVWVELASVDEYQNGQGCDCFANGPDGDDGVAGPGLGARRGAVSAVQVDSCLAIDRYADRGTQFSAGFQLLGKRVAQTAEARVAVALDRHGGVHRRTGKPALRPERGVRGQNEGKDKQISSAHFDSC